MKTGNVLKRQQPDQRAENSSGPPLGLQLSDKIPYPEVLTYDRRKNAAELNIRTQNDGLKPRELLDEIHIC